MPRRGGEAPGPSCAAHALRKKMSGHSKNGWEWEFGGRIALFSTPEPAPLNFSSSSAFVAKVPGMAGILGCGVFYGTPSREKLEKSLKTAENFC